MTVFGLSVGEAIAIATVLIGIVGGFVRLQMRATQNTREAAEALRVAREARDQVNAVRLEIAQKYASVSYLKEVETRLVLSMDRLTERIDKLLSSFGK